MKYCSHCGAQLMDEAVVCVRCGCSTGYQPPRQSGTRDEAMMTVIKVFLILGCVSTGWLLIPLSWTIPITVSVFRKLKTGQPISTGQKVCSLIFVNLIAGILLLCMDD